MKILSFFHNGNEIEIHNNIWGKETILYNGEKMTSHYSFFGKNHCFSVKEEGDWVDYEVQVGFAAYGVGFNIYRNGETLMESLSRTRSHGERKKKYNSNFLKKGGAIPPCLKVSFQNNFSSINHFCF